MWRGTRSLPGIVLSPSQCFPWAGDWPDSGLQTPTLIEAFPPPDESTSVYPEVVLVCQRPPCFRAFSSLPHPSEIALIPVAHDSPTVGWTPGIINIRDWVEAGPGSVRPRIMGFSAGPPSGYTPNRCTLDYSVLRTTLQLSGYCQWDIGLLP